MAQKCSIRFLDQRAGALKHACTKEHVCDSAAATHGVKCASSQGQPTHVGAHKYWQLRTAKARPAVQKLINLVSVQYCVFQFHLFSPTIFCERKQTSMILLELLASIIVMKSNETQ